MRINKYLSLLCFLSILATTVRVQAQAYNYEEALRNPQKVRVLNLLAKEVESFSKNVHRFSNLASLTFTPDKHIPKEFAQLKRLKFLKFRQNQVKQLPHEFKNLTLLKGLTFYDGGTVPKGIGQLTNLKILTLHQVAIAPEVMKEVGNLRKLEQFSAHDVGIEKLPENFVQLKQLKYMYLYHNRITAFPKNIGHLKNLEMLATDAPITSIPASFWNLQELKILALLDLKLKKLSPDIGKLQQLEKLSLSIHQFNQLPQEIAQLIHLKEFKVYHQAFSNTERLLVKQWLPDTKVYFE